MQPILLALLYYLGAKLSLAFAIMPEALIMLWVPNGIVLTAMFHLKAHRYAPLAALIVVAQIAAAFPTFPPTEAALFGAINLLEVATAYFLLRRWRFGSRFAVPSDLSKFVLAGPVIGALPAACGSAAVYGYFRGDQTGYFEFLRVWWFSDALGLLILTPLALSIWPPVTGPGAPAAGRRWYDGVALFGALAVFVAVLSSDRGIFHGVSVRPILLLLPVLYAAARFSLRTTTITLAVSAAVVLFATKTGRQPFGDLPSGHTVVMVQEFLFVMAIMSLGLAALLSQARANARDLEARVRDRTAALSAANTRLEKLAVTDPLTGLLNRRALFGLLQREIERSRRHGRELAIILFDVDHFKAVNDRHGHAVGDRVLRRVAAATARVIRHTDTMARYGGEEFVLVAPETDEQHAMQLAERMRQELKSSPVALGNDALRITASFGVALLDTSDTAPEELLSRADCALYAAKADGRDRVAACGQ